MKRKNFDVTKSFGNVKNKKNKKNRQTSQVVLLPLDLMSQKEQKRRTSLKLFFLTTIRKDIFPKTALNSKKITL